MMNECLEKPCLGYCLYVCNIYLKNVKYDTGFLSWICQKQVKHLIYLHVGVYSSTAVSESGMSHLVVSR